MRTSCSSCAPGAATCRLRSDGLTVDEEGLVRRSAGVLEPAQPGVVRSLLVHLTPGRYVLFCNMSGHFLGGMRRVLIVR